MNHTVLISSQNTEIVEGSARKYSGRIIQSNTMILVDDRRASANNVRLMSANQELRNKTSNNHIDDTAGDRMASEHATSFTSSCDPNFRENNRVCDKSPTRKEQLCTEYAAMTASQRFTFTAVTLFVQKELITICAPSPRILTVARGLLAANFSWPATSRATRGVWWHAQAEIEILAICFTYADVHLIACSPNRLRIRTRSIRVAGRRQSHQRTR